MICKKRKLECLELELDLSVCTHGFNYIEVKTEELL